MIVEKINFIAKDSPDIERQISDKKVKLNRHLKIESELTKKISKSDSFEELENLIAQLNEKYRQKGEFENIISQISEVSSAILNLEKQLNEIDVVLYSEEFEEKLKEQLSKFNKHFSTISNEL